MVAMKVVWILQAINHQCPPKILQSPEEYPSVEENIPVENQNGDKQIARVSPDASVKIRRYLNFVLALTYFYTKPLIEVE
ncbi:hypothetical protein NQ314_002525 [Rhamnusium bicolor]|uniref:Uncharacterized protein n=1 Tax=Rhamnusium bicolor TaxID=1586634 RepID=A0AAV8ZR25_9CUCU|nr:hypothetical protein NQ314_002525 [Rhamnusium bicolor]